jgi:arsenate reductase
MVARIPLARYVIDDVVKEIDLMNTVIFACVHNAGRSQMAAAFFNALADPAKARAISAGTQPGDRVHPEVVEVMKESRIDLSDAQPRKLTAELARGTVLLVTMGCGEACPHVPGLVRDDWPLPDPKGQPQPRVREIRDAVRDRVRGLLAARGWERAGGGTAAEHR